MSFSTGIGRRWRHQARYETPRVARLGILNGGDVVPPEIAIPTKVGIHGATAETVEAWTLTFVGVTASL